MNFGFNAFNYSSHLWEITFRVFFLQPIFSFSLCLTFFFCNLNGKPPDVCLMLEESEICII